ncbi:MAG TPA: hypothetical protein VMR21_11640, partial [Vicinamibacteria bacterium]|nr:hypothetical protein [Vicinamibacteria bacterium]
GLAVLAKLAPLVLVPLVLRRTGAARLLLAAAVVVAGYIPFAGAGPALFTGLSTFARDWQFNAGPFYVLRAGLATLVQDADGAARLAVALIAAAVSLRVGHRAGPDPGAFPGAAATVLGVLIVLSPVVMPWYVTWLLPFAVVAGRLPWLALSGLTGFAFLVMVDGTEHPAALIAEWGLFALVAALAHRGRLRAVLLPGGVRMKWIGLVGLVAVLVAAPDAGAQGSGSTAGSLPGSFTMVREVEGTLVSANEAEALITVDDKKTGERITFKTDAKIKLRADSKSALGGRRDLKLGDFPAGQPVRVTYRTTDRVAVELKLKKSRP